MSGRRVFLTVVVILLVVVLLAGAGACLYRLGYAHGVAAAGTLAGAGELPRLFGRGMPGFDGGRVQVWPYGGMMVYSRHVPFGMFGFGGWLVGLLLLAGVVGLVVWVVNVLTRKRPVEVQAVPAPAAPAAVQPTPAKRTRVAKRTR